jgi:hypothetical protein
MHLILGGSESAKEIVRQISDYLNIGAVARILIWLGSQNRKHTAF